MAKTNGISFIAAALAARHGVEWREAENFLTCLFALIGDGLREDRIVKIKGLGTFKVVDVRERESIDVNTGERIVIGSRAKVTFTPDNVLKDLVNKPFAQFETVVLNEGVAFDDEPAAAGDAPVTGDDGGQQEQERQEPSGTTVTADAGAEAVGEAAGDDAGETGATGASVQDDVTEDMAGDSAGEDTPERDESGTDMPADADDADDDADADDGDDGDDDGDGDDGDSGRRSLRWLWVTLLVLVVAAVMFVLGYYAGRGGKVRIFTSPEDSVTAVPETPEEQDTAGVNGRETADTAATAAAGTPAPAVTDTAVVGKDTADAAHDADARLQRARLMVAKGAYVITGTAETITVPPGRTMRQISRYYFGDGMECYLQVHNNVMEVSEGMTLKIPELRNKKVRK